MQPAPGHGELATGLGVGPLAVLEQKAVAVAARPPARARVPTPPRLAFGTKPGGVAQGPSGSARALWIWWP